MVDLMMRSLLVNGSRACLRPASMACYNTSSVFNNQTSSTQSRTLTVSKPTIGASPLLANRLAVQSLHTTPIQRDIDPAAKSTDDGRRTDGGARSAGSENYGSPITWKSVGIGGSVIAITLGYLYKMKFDRDKLIAERNKMSMGAADIKCKFDLVDTDGKTRTSDEFLGRWLLVYFGFTYCPDVCPEELEKLSTAIDRLHEAEFDVTPIFITVDPNRDKPELLRRYLDEFSKKWIGLTGDDEQIGRTAKSFRVYYSPGPKDRDNDYIVDHTIISYLIGPKGQLMEYFGQTKNVDEIENVTKYHMKMYKGD